MMVQADLNDKLQRDVLVPIFLYRSILSKLILELSSKEGPMNLKYKSKMKMLFLKELPLNDQKVYMLKPNSPKWGP